MESTNSFSKPRNRATFLAHLAAAACCLAAATASAQATGQQPGGHRGPPPEALEACKSLTAGDACSFAAGDASREGTCWAPEGKPLACRPSDAPKQGGRESPPESN